MDAAGPLALIILGLILGWIIELVIDFMILRPYWITQGRESAADSQESDLQETITQIADMQINQSGALSHLNTQLSEMAERTSFDESPLRDVIEDMIITLEQLHKEQNQLIERTAFDDGPLRHVLEDIVVTLNEQGQMLERLEALDGQLAGTAEVLTATLYQQIATLTTTRLDDITGTLEAYEMALQRLEALVTQGLNEIQSIRQQPAPAAPQGPLMPTRAPRPRPRRSDRLTDLKGVGPSYADRLQLAGIHTFDQLAALTPEELGTLMNMQGTEKIAKWVEQAQNIVASRSKIEDLR